MEHIDGDVAFLRRIAERKNYITLETGMYVDEEPIEFERKELPGGKIAVVLPKDFTLMTPEAAAIKYPSIHRPEIIYSNAMGTVNFAFSHKAEAIAIFQLKTCAAQFKEAIKRTNPAIIFYESGEMPVGKTELHYFDFQSFSFDMQTYNLMYISIIENKVLHGVFNCPAKFADEWKPIVRQILGTIDDLTIRKEIIPR